MPSAWMQGASSKAKVLSSLSPELPLKHLTEDGRILSVACEAALAAFEGCQPTGRVFEREQPVVKYRL
jgi:hypothetical protein